MTRKEVLNKNLKFNDKIVTCKNKNIVKESWAEQFDLGAVL